MPPQSEQFINYLVGQPITLSNAVNSVFGPSGPNASIGLVPVPASTAGTTNFLREDGTWTTPASGITVFTSTTSGLVPNPNSAPATYTLLANATWAQPAGSQLLGTSTNDNAAAGNVGEYISLTTTVLVSLAASTPGNIGSIALGAGDWDINGTVSFTSSTSTNQVNYNAMCIASTSATFNQTNGFYYVQCYADSAAARGGEPYNNLGGGPLSSTGNGIITLYTGCTRVSVSACTSYFLLGQSSDTPTEVFGIIQARRVR